MVCGFPVCWYLLQQDIKWLLITHHTTERGLPCNPARLSTETASQIKHKKHRPAYTSRSRQTNRRACRRAGLVPNGIGRPMKDAVIKHTQWLLQNLGLEQKRQRKEEELITESSGLKRTLTSQRTMETLTHRNITCIVMYLKFCLEITRTDS